MIRLVNVIALLFWNGNQLLHRKKQDALYAALEKLKGGIYTLPFFQSIGQTKNLSTNYIIIIKVFLWNML